jgi:hypothetical protein
MAYEPVSEVLGVHWTQVNLVGDLNVGKGAFEKRYIHGLSPLQLVDRMSVGNSTNFQWPVDESPILPNGRPRPPPKERKGVSGMMDKWTKRAPKMADINLQIYRAAKVPLLQRAEDNLRIADVVGICYDCSRPETLQSVIHKVRALSPTQHFFKSKRISSGIR